MKFLGGILFCLAMFVLPILYFFEFISLAKFVPLFAVWMFGSAVLYVGPEAISKISYGALSIERDVAAARRYRDESEQIRNDLRKITKLAVENEYIFASTGSMAMEGGMPKSEARKRVEKNLGLLSELAEPIKERESEWWADLESVFASRKGAE